MKFLALAILRLPILTIALLARAARQRVEQRSDQGADWLGLGSDSFPHARGQY